MKFIVSSNLLLKNLQSIAGILNARNTMPILDDFLFVLSNGTLKITASDLETTMSTELTVDIYEGEGTIAIPAKTLTDMLKTFSDIPITFTIDEVKQSVEISACDGNYRMSGHNGDEFPKAPEFDDTNKISLPADTLTNAISKTLFATSNEELRPVITGVLFDIYPEEIIFVATDAHKLVKYSKISTAANESSSFIVPKKPLNQLKNILANTTSDVEIEYNATNVTFSFDNIKLFSRLINGTFPNYASIIPTNNPNTLQIDKNNFINSLRRVSFFANQSTNQIRIAISGQTITISGEDIEYASEAKEIIACEYDGSDIVIGFNSRFLMEMVSHVDTPKIRVELSAPNRAALVLPVEEEESDEKLTMLISPVMLNN
ncbi:MAG: DNA polymerase III subunit beta [Bacteroidales bacterium]|nr:DNA polymerase III subunit beta [Bacteroidales bacterium]MDD2203845.1 DNA polymerase III subunit beta [Bacteroidales bacterium]MDD3913139.1 DNA polymerase III subunit beta [Bacteroidales bacterium]MDD4633054.1 DNA polymerase III subunit beta [Bacteroidales bacterium]